MDQIKTTKTTDSLRSEWLEACATISLFRDASIKTRQQLGLELLEYCGALISIAHNLPTAKALNSCIYPHELDVYLSAAELRLIFESRGATRYQLHQNMFAPPPSAEKLQSNNFINAGLCHKIEFSLIAPQITDQRHEVVKIGHNQAWDFGLMICQSLGLHENAVALFSELPMNPDWHVFMIYQEYLPVGVAALFIQGRYAWLPLIVTCGSNKQHQIAVISQCLYHARGHGCTKLYSKYEQNASIQQSISKEVLLSMGFQKTYSRNTYENTQLDLDKYNGC